MGVFTFNGTFCSSFSGNQFPGAEWAESFSSSNVSFVVRVDQRYVREVIAGSLTRGGSLPSLSTEQIDMLEESPRNDKVIRDWIDSVTSR